MLSNRHDLQVWTGGWGLIECNTCSGSSPKLELFFADELGKT